MTWGEWVKVSTDDGTNTAAIIQGIADIKPSFGSFSHTTKRHTVYDIILDAWVKKHRITVSAAPATTA